MDRARPLDESRHLRHGILGWYRHGHVHVIGHHVAFEDLTLLLLRQPMKHFAQVLLQLSVQRLSPTLRDKTMLRQCVMLVLQWLVRALLIDEAALDQRKRTAFQ
jgi:hypothetical protein